MESPQMMKAMKFAALALVATMLWPVTGSAYETTRKFNPGHYSVILRAHNNDQRYMDDARRPGMRGITKKYLWRQLEPTQGKYDFSMIQRDLYWAQAYGMQLVIMIEDKTFKAERPNPAYLDYLAPGNVDGGYTMVRWHPTVLSRYKALVTAMGSRFDANANFEGIAAQETSLGLTTAVRNAFGYTPEKYRDAYINAFSHALNVMPRSRVFWYQNFFPLNQSYIGTIARTLGPKGLVMAGPDVLPDRDQLVSMSYPFFDQLQGQMHMAIQIEDICYRALHETAGYATKYWTMAELFRYARDRLHSNYIFWVRIPAPALADSYSWTHALPVIENNPVFNQ
jgi:hypothetical protein